MRRFIAFCWCAVAVFGVRNAVSAPSRAAESGPTSPPAVHRVYSHLYDPREHPDHLRRPVQPPNWDTFGGRTAFMCLRGFPVRDGRIVDIGNQIDRYTKVHDLGEIIWPSYDVLFTTNVAELADEIRRRDLFLFDIWGYVPGSGPGGYWQQFHPPREALRTLEERLGPRWLGMDNGEQDGRYIGGYASQMHPQSDDRFEQYLNFQRHFEKLGDELGNRLATLVSLNFGHYFLKEGTYTLIGAETAQALPNSQVYYAFIRGAGKQYGVPWFGNASIFNRWGYKSYDSEAADHGVLKGTSLSLLKRLLYSHILYNSVAVGFENGWLRGDELTPIGRIQQSARRWSREYGRPGVMHTPVALLLDFFSGWSSPRHLYSGHVYRVWGNVPYAHGDYLTHGVLDVLYPGYQESSYFRDESGFIAATPYGDIADCLLSDAPLWLLNRYPVVVVAGGVSGGMELRDKLDAYVRQGGQLVITAGNLPRLPGSLAGIRVLDGSLHFEAGTPVHMGQAVITEEHPFELMRLNLPDNARILANCGANPAAAEISLGLGRVIVMASPFGLPAGNVLSQPIRNEPQIALPNPFPLLRHVRAILDDVFSRQRLFEADPRLSLITCRRRAGEYTLGVCNNTWSPLPLKIRSLCGAIENISEIALDTTEKQAAEYMPEAMTADSVGKSDDTTIAGGDVRLFTVRVREQGIEEIAKTAVPTRPVGRLLSLRKSRSIKEQILSRPTFFQHFDGVVVDARQLRRIEPDALRSEAGWLNRQQVRTVVDATSLINLYPDLRLVDNIPTEHEAAMTTLRSIMSKMEILSSRDLVIALHRHPENNFTPQQTEAAFERSLRDLCRSAAQRGITIHLRLSLHRPPWLDLASAGRWLDRVGEPNLRLALSTAGLLAQDAGPPPDLQKLRDRIGLWLAAAPERDVQGSIWSEQGRLAGRGVEERVARLISLAPNVPVALEAVYADWDEEYADILCLPKTAKPTTASAASGAP